MRNNSTWAPSAPSPTPWPRDAWNVPLTLLAGVGTAVVYVVPLLIYLGAAIALRAIDPRDLAHLPANQLLLAQVVSYFPLALYLVAVLPKLARVPLADLGLRKPTRRELGIGVAGTAVMWLAVTLVGGAIAAITHRHDTETAIALLQQMQTPAQKFTFFVIGCVLAPMLEELTFRVFLFNALTRYLTIPLAALASGIVFGAVHVSSAGQLLTVGIPLAVGGAILAYVYAITRNYWANVTTHGLFNTISVVAIFVFHAT